MNTKIEMTYREATDLFLLLNRERSKNIRLLSLYNSDSEADLNIRANLVKSINNYSRLAKKIDSDWFRLLHDAEINEAKVMNKD